MTQAENLSRLNERITDCKRCPRLAKYIRDVAKNKVRRFSSQDYWGKPLPGFGDANARLLLIGLAPAAHGGNRTGRMFTGDSSGNWLARALYDNGFATQPTSEHRDDGLLLKDAYITAAARCAPPDNKPLKEELKNCQPYLEEELKILKNVKVIVCLGRIAFDACCSLFGIRNAKFSHKNVLVHEDFTIICSYHPSKQNTQTGRLKWSEWNAVFVLAKKHLKSKC
jgi:uracil-DNA glycosylase